MKIEKDSINYRNLKSIQRNLSVILERSYSEKEALKLLLEVCNRNTDVLAKLLSGK
ncbi:hypothetical protein [Planococcus plakortidis]|uniref:hypothetical protein n=1 Tax=Planococcus plakortidis TaxID=1038856 RepID=UPI0012EE25E8|nr:hypothetical protein [Planococcus plakortidis]